MFLNLSHKKLDVYVVAIKLICLTYKMTAKMPANERFNLVSQTRRAAMSVMLNIAEGASRKSSGERKRFYEISRSSLVELDAAAEVSLSLEILKKEDLGDFNELVSRCFSMLSKMIAGSK